MDSWLQYWDSFMQLYSQEDPPVSLVPCLLLWVSTICILCFSLVCDDFQQLHVFKVGKVLQQCRILNLVTCQNKRQALRLLGQWVGVSSTCSWALYVFYLTQMWYWSYVVVGVLLSLHLSCILHFYSTLDVQESQHFNGDHCVHTQYLFLLLVWGSQLLLQLNSSTKLWFCSASGWWQSH